MVWYRIGSMDEVDGASGVAHVLEHADVQGNAERRPRRIQQASPPPAGDNAFQPRLHRLLPAGAGKLPEMMQLEADRMRHLGRRSGIRDQSRHGRRRMRTDDNPQSRLFEQMNAVAFQAHPTAARSSAG